jgi:DnaK suppressor protein
MTLSKAEVSKFKKRLEDLRAQMTDLVRGASDMVKSVDESKGYSQNQSDEGTDDSSRNINLEVSGKELKILRQIERALEKIEEESYGICDVSEEEIPGPRLDAVPYATMTVKSQDKMEKGLL